MLPPDVCEHSGAQISFSSHYKDPTTHPTHVLPSVLCSFTSESAAQPHCLLLGADGTKAQSCSFLSASVAKPWGEAGPAPSMTAELKSF